VICHLVLFNLKDGLETADIGRFANLMRDTCVSAQSVARVRVGRRVSVDAGYERFMGLKTYDFVAVVEFDDVEGLVAYLRHPKHDELGRMFWEYCSDALVIESQMHDPIAVDETSGF
jgi:hypothetical protein